MALRIINRAAFIEAVYAAAGASLIGWHFGSWLAGVGLFFLTMAVKPR